MDLVAIPEATFEMGSTEEELLKTEGEWSGRLIDPSYRSVFRDWLRKEHPSHQVHLKAFRMGRFPVRNDEYREFLQAPTANGNIACPESLQLGLPNDHPVWGVGIAEAQAFVVWRRARDRVPWRLPTEAEWEWAASGPNGSRYPFGDYFDPELCNTVESSRGVSCPVDAHPAGASYWGVEDLAGNVEEWTASVYSPYPGGEIIHDDLMQILGPGYPILRGGSFALGGDLARTRRRHGPHPGAPFRITGFRLVVNEDCI